MQKYVSDIAWSYIYDINSKLRKFFQKNISHAVTTIEKFTTFAVSKRFLLGHRLCENNREYGVNPWQCLLLWVPSRGALPIVEKTDKSREMYLRNSLPLALRCWEGFVSGTSQKTYLLLFTGFVTAGLRDKSKLIFIRNIHFRRTALGIFSRWLALALRQNEVLS